MLEGTNRLAGRVVRRIAVVAGALLLGAVSSPALAADSGITAAPAGEQSTVPPTAAEEVEAAGFPPDCSIHVAMAQHSQNRSEYWAVGNVWCNERTLPVIVDLYMFYPTGSGNVHHENDNCILGPGDNSCNLTTESELRSGDPNQEWCAQFDVNWGATTTTEMDCRLV